MGKFLATEGGPAMRKCAFCKHYYDPTSSVISPKRGSRNVWEYESHVKKPCTIKHNMPVASHQTCPKYECKF